MIVLGFVILWLWEGFPSGPGGIAESLIEIIVIALIVPLMVWIIGKIAI